MKKLVIVIALALLGGSIQSMSVKPEKLYNKFISRLTDLEREAPRYFLNSVKDPEPFINRGNNLLREIEMARPPLVRSKGANAIDGLQSDVQSLIAEFIDPDFSS